MSDQQGYQRMPHISKTEIRSDALLYVGDALIGKVMVTAGSSHNLVSQNACPQTGKLVRLFEHIKDGRTAFVSLTDGLSQSTKGLNHSARA